jgi:hypothetical protein
VKQKRLISLFSVALVLAAVATVAAAQSAQQSPEPKRSLGVSLSLPNGSFVGFPIQDGTPDDYLTPIPVSGYKNVFGIRMYPHMVGDKVALRLWVMVPKTAPAAAAQPLDPTKVPHKHQLVGDYVIGKEGDSLLIADVNKVGLPVLTAKVVRAAFSESPEDPCCCTTNGLVCCGGTYVEMCKTCANVCPTCGGLGALKGGTRLLPSTDVKPTADAAKNH